MDDFEILQGQISDQVINIYNFDVSFSDAKNEIVRTSRTDNNYYIWPLFKNPKKITRFQYDAIIAMSDDFIADTESREFSIKGWFSYNEFMNEFYNAKQALALDCYISNNHKSNSDFARHINVNRQQVNEWLNKDFVIVGQKMYSFRKDIEQSI